LPGEAQGPPWGKVKPRKKGEIGQAARSLIPTRNLDIGVLPRQENEHRQRQGIKTTKGKSKQKEIIKKGIKMLLQSAPRNSLKRTSPPLKQTASEKKKGRISGKGGISEKTEQQ